LTMDNGERNPDFREDVMPELMILPSLLSANFGNLSKDVAAVEGGCADALHCDIMDGRFVPNITFGPLVVKAVNSLTALPLYVHLMIEHPEQYVDAFVKAGADEITVHAEACVHLHSVLHRIKDAGIRAGVALNPHTPLCMVKNLISDMDVLLVMTVNPGFGGQSFIEAMVPKIAEARRMAEQAGVALDIAVDGGIDTRSIAKVTRAGANAFVAGAFVFSNANMTPHEACSALRHTAENAYSAVEA